MMTPQEAEAHVFPKASFGGYNTPQVDAFLESLIGDYRELYQENASLKGKLKLLVDKVEEYRDTEEAMRRALHSAQKMAEELIREGEAKKQSTINEAVAEVQRRSQEARNLLAQEEAVLRSKIDDAKADLANEQLRLETARKSTAAFLDRLKDLYAKELSFIGSLSDLQAQMPEPEPEPPSSPPPAPSAPGDASTSGASGDPSTSDAPSDPSASGAPTPAGGEHMAEDIQANMAKLLDEPVPAGKESAAAGEEEDTRVFDQIEFGKDYDIE